jgi:septal ring factor EnvC (AmiA/AmiB activator)
MYVNARATAVHSLRHAEMENSIISSVFSASTLGMKLLSLWILSVRSKLTDSDNRYTQLSRKLELYDKERSHRDEELMQMKKQLNEILKRLDAVDAS